MNEIDARNYWHELKQRLASNEAATVFLALNKSIPADSAHFDNLVILESEYHNIESDYRKGIINDEYKRVVQNRLNDKLLSLINILSKTTVSFSSSSYLNAGNFNNSISKQIRAAALIEDIERGVTRGYSFHGTGNLLINKFSNANVINSKLIIKIIRDIRIKYENDYWNVKSLKNEIAYKATIDLEKLVGVKIAHNPNDIKDYFNENIFTISIISVSNQSAINSEHEILSISNAFYSLPGREYEKYSKSQKQIIDLQFSGNRIDANRFVSNFEQLIKAHK